MARFAGKPESAIFKLLFGVQKLAVFIDTVLAYQQTAAIKAAV